MITAHGVNGHVTGVNGHVAFGSAKVCAVIATFAERKATFPMPAPLLSTCPSRLLISLYPCNGSRQRPVDFMDFASGIV